MSRRPALITQADVRRIIAAAKAAGASSVEIPTLAGNVIVRLTATGDQPEATRDIQL